ncbi:P-loop containing nucleoside triphosphate hydrolase protein [Sistotremastrum suecicum HHB10207 ss-3]|uniref:DNA 3'-5' helicase n=1 Tax=Sistotremastrum suecicum HHB10207 ss-3 TaxID=1314776 RepID=A0A166BKD9_9AGAM|nr:P-loop containing nucleoside triphosphate hydrolase protein [Sistotremastrum suecicum HHB10207 ss-3]
MAPVSRHGKPLPPGSPDRRRKRAGQPDKSVTKVWHEKNWSGFAQDLRSRLNLTFDPEEWQARTILSILAGKDVIFAAGTGYGKSLVFEGLASQRPRKTVVVICPLKALENDQVAAAEAKGLRAAAINESTEDKEAAWEQLEKGAYRLVYISPEMALSPRFRSLCTNQQFRNKLSALIVDEAHCIEQWGDEFRPAYKELDRLRCYSGTSIPFVACSGTMTTGAFETVWNSLDFGHRRFWGVDVGCHRPELTYVIQKLTNEDDPALDLLDLVPELKNLTKDSKPEDIPKILMYFSTQSGTKQASLSLRASLPEHLRSCVFPFNALLSEDAKKDAWLRFSEGKIRILCSTDAAGMGCNALDVKYVVVVGQKLKSLSVLVQRWGRAARGRGLTGKCWLLMPEWAFEREPQPQAVTRLIEDALGKSGTKKKKKKAEKKETKEALAQRAALQYPLLNLINAKSELRSMVGLVI